MRQDVIDSLQLAQKLAQASKNDGAAALRNSSNIEALLTSAIPSIVYGEPTTRLIFTTTQEQVVLSTTGATSTNDLEFAFPTTGWVTGLIATVAEGHQFCSMLSAKLRIQDVANIFTTGRTEAMCPLSMISGVDARNSNIFPLRRRVDSTMRWYVRYTSQTAQFPASGTATYTPIIACVFSEDALGVR